MMSEMTTKLQPQRSQKPQKELALPGVLFGAAAVVGVMVLLVLPLQHLAGEADQTQWMAHVPIDPIARVQWVLGDMTEPQFYGSWIASLGLLFGAFLAWFLQRRKSALGGCEIAYGSGLWLWMLGAASLSLLLSNLLFGASLQSEWQPTFVPFVCVATALVLVYGRGWKVLLTGAVMGSFTTPLAMVLISYVSTPLGLPGVVANTAAMSVGTSIVFLIVRILPWMKLPVAESAQMKEAPAQSTPNGFLADAWWTIRRVICDFTETQFWATEWASLGVIFGAVLSLAVAPMFTAGGSGLLPQVLIAQVLTSAIGVTVWRHLYRGGGFTPTYISLVSVAPAATLVYGGSLVAMISSAILGALLCPLIAVPVTKWLPRDFHPVVANTLSMAVSTAVIVPAISLIPGVVA